MWRIWMSERVRVALALASTLIASPALAQEKVWCGSNFGLAQASALGLAVVTGPDRAYFNGFDSACQKRREPCQLKGYLIGGNVVVTSTDRRDGLTCVKFVGSAGETTGWVEAKRLKALPVATSLTTKDWLGDWRRDDMASFSVTRRKGQLYASGNALYFPYNPDGTPTRPGPNTGEFSGRLRLQGNRAEVSSLDYCMVRMTRIGPYALVEDDNKCGGLNVTFRGFYRRASGS